MVRDSHTTPTPAPALPLKGREQSRWLEALPLRGRVWVGVGSVPRTQPATRPSVTPTCGACPLQRRALRPQAQRFLLRAQRIEPCAQPFQHWPTGKNTEAQGGKPRTVEVFNFARDGQTPARGKKNLAIDPRSLARDPSNLAASHRGLPAPLRASRARPKASHARCSASRPRPDSFARGCFGVAFGPSGLACRPWGVAVHACGAGHHQRASATGSASLRHRFRFAQRQVAAAAQRRSPPKPRGFSG